MELPNNGMAKNRTGTSDYPIYSNGNGTFFGGLAEGEPLYRFYGYKAIGIYQTDEEAAKSRIRSDGKKDLIIKMERLLQVENLQVTIFGLTEIKME